MKFKNIWFISAILFFDFIPLKVVSFYQNIEFVNSGWFIGLFLLLIFLVPLLAGFEKLDMDNIDVRKNIPLGIVSLFVSLSFFWCIPTYYADTTQYDLEWQPIMMGLLSILTCITFIIMSITFFIGKNLFSKASFFIFCPVFWFAFDMILFLSMQNNNVNVYNIALTAFLALFFLYYTQVFSTSSKMNIIKLMVGLGVPAVLLAIPRWINAMIQLLGNSKGELSDVELSTCTMEAVVSVYIVLVMIDICRQIQDNSKLRINQKA